MPTFIFKIEQYQVVESKEAGDDADAPQTLINVDSSGSGNIALHAPDEERALMYVGEHLRIHKNWDALQPWISHFN